MNAIKSSLNKIPETAGDYAINLLIALYSVACSFVSDWLSQTLANLLKMEKSSSWTLALILILAVVSTQLVKLWVDKQERKDQKATDKIILLGNSFSMILLVRVFSPCWSDCLTCEVQGPTAPLLKSGIALLPFLFSAGISYQTKSAQSEASNQWLNFGSRFDHKRIIFKAIMEKAGAIGKEKKGDVVGIHEEEIVKFYKRNNILFDNINQIREQMSLFAIDAQSKGGIPFGSHHYKLELEARKHDGWAIVLYKFPGRLK